MVRAALVALWAAVVPVPGVGEVEGWHVGATEHGCGISRVFEEGRHPTDLKMLLFADGRSALVLKNEGWSVKTGTKGTLDVVLDGQVFSGPAAASSDHAVMMIPNDAMLHAFGMAKFLTAFWNEKPIENMPLDGSGAALAKARECNAGVRRAKEQAAAERRRLDRREQKIATDPFVTEK